MRLRAAAAALVICVLLLPALLLSQTPRGKFSEAPGPTALPLVVVTPIFGEAGGAELARLLQLLQLHALGLRVDPAWVPAARRDDLCRRHQLCGRAVRAYEHRRDLPLPARRTDGRSLVVADGEFGAAEPGAAILSLAPGSAEWIGRLPLRALVSWHRARIHIVVLAYRRARSLRRLCDSLLAAHYLHDRVDLTIHLDAALAPDREAAAATAEFAARWDWPHGRKTLVRQAEHRGLMRSVTEAWQPQSDDEFAVLLEDDVSVSPQWYEFAKLALLTYVYGRTRDPK